MKREILRCSACHEYTLKKVCPSCGGVAVSPKPAKYSPEDKYGIWRRAQKKSQKFINEKEGTEK